MATYELHGERASETGRSEYPHFTAAELAPRVVRSSGLTPAEGSEDMAIIGAGGGSARPRFAEAHSFRIGGAQQAPGGGKRRRSQDADVFVVHSGQWRFDLGEKGDDAQLYLSPGDVISVPAGTSRSINNVGTAPGFLWSVHGGDQPRPADGDAEEPDARRWTNEEAASLIVRDSPGRDLKEIVAPGAAIGWAHGFILSRIDLGIGEAWDSLATPSPHVLWCHRGRADISAKDGLIELAEGDTMSVPAGFNARITTTEGTVLFKVERFDDERLREAVPQPGRAQQTEDVRARQAA